MTSPKASNSVGVRARTECAAAHADQRIAAEGVAERRHPLGPLVDGAVTEPDLHLVQGQVSLRSQPAVQVDRVGRVSRIPTSRAACTSASPMALGSS